MFDDDLSDTDVKIVIMALVLFVIAGGYATAAHQPILDTPRVPVVYWRPDIGVDHAPSARPQKLVEDYRAR